MPTFDTPEPISVNVELGVGDLQIVASDRADTVVEVEPSDPDQAVRRGCRRKTTVEYANGVLRIKAPKGWKRYSFRGGAESIDVRVELPTGSHLRGDAGLATLRCSGALGECRYKTGAGDITVEQIAGDGRAHHRHGGGQASTGSVARPRSRTATGTPGSARSSAIFR